jgi:hypothetical protein
MECEHPLTFFALYNLNTYGNDDNFGTEMEAKPGFIPDMGRMGRK